jgi:hypothetical protein
MFLEKLKVVFVEVVKRSKFAPVIKLQKILEAISSYLKELF